jgi:hypothetical protein
MFTLVLNSTYVSYFCLATGVACSSSMGEPPASVVPVNTVHSNKDACTNDSNVDKWLFILMRPLQQQFRISWISANCQTFSPIFSSKRVMYVNPFCGVGEGRNDLSLLMLMLTKSFRESLRSPNMVALSLSAWRLTALVPSSSSSEWLLSSSASISGMLHE